MRNKLTTIKTLQKELLSVLGKGIATDKDGKEGFYCGNVNKEEIKRLRITINKLVMEFEQAQWWVYDD